MTPKDAIRNNFPEEEFQLYAIALFDVLGFSELHKKVGTKDLYSTYADLINFVIIASKAPAMLKYETIEGTSVAIDVDIRYVYFSDTIVLWTTFNPKHFDLFLKFEVQYHILFEVPEGRYPELLSDAFAGSIIGIIRP